MQKAQPQATALAVLFLLLLLAGLAGRFWASDKAYQFTGPTHIAAGGQYVYLFASGDIYRLTHSGELVSVSGPGATGLNDHPIDLRVLSDGRLLIAEQQPASIRLCNVDSWACRPIGASAGSVIERQFKALPGSAPGELFLTDARGDTLWRLDSAGGEPQKLVENGILSGPNDIAFDQSGNLWIADTDHRRIVELLPRGDGGWEPGREHSAVNALTVGERFYPMMLAKSADRRWWVIQAAEFSKPYADLVVYDSGSGVQELIDLPDGSYPTDIVALDDSMLVTDLERFTVYRVQYGSGKVIEFGDERFRRSLDRIRSQRAHYDRLGAGSLAAVILFGGLMLLAAVKATPKEQRWTQPPVVLDLENAPEQVPGTTGIHWLERDPKAEQALKWLEHLGFGLFVLLVAGALALYLGVRIYLGPDAGEEAAKELDELGFVLLLAGLAGAFAIPFIKQSLRAFRHKLGTDGSRVYIRLENGRELAADPSQLFYTDRAVLYRKYTLPLLAGKQRPLYMPGEVETWLAPLLTRARRLSEFQAIKHQWTNRDGQGAWMLIAGAAMVLLLILFSMLD